MNKKIYNKGFTLMELIAVVVIISVIALLVIPQIVRKSRESKQKLYDTQMNTVVSSARLYMINNEINGEITLSVGDLQKEGLLDKDIKDPTTGKPLNKCIQVSITRVGDNYQYTIDDSKISDCIQSNEYIMILVGGSEIEIDMNKTYIDPGVIIRKKSTNEIVPNDGVYVKVENKSTGRIDENIKYSELSNYIDTSNEYEYKITYYYKNETTADIESKERYVKVVDPSKKKVNYNKPAFTINPKTWSFQKEVTINYDETKTDELNLIKSSAPLKINNNKKVVECTSIDALYECTEIQTDELKPGTWYKILDNNTTFVTESNGVILAKKTNGYRYETENYSITTIDRTPPTNITYEIEKRANKLIVKNINASDFESGIYGYQLSIDGNNWKTIKYPTNNIEFEIKNNGDYQVIIRAINNTIGHDEQNGINNDKGNELMAIKPNNEITNIPYNTISTVSDVIRFNLNPPAIIPKTVAKKSDTLIINYKITDSENPLQILNKTDIKSIKCEYGKTNNYELGEVNNSNVTMDYCKINNLTPGTTYYYKITVEDNYGNVVVYENNAKTESIVDPIITIKGYDKNGNEKTGWSYYKNATINYYDTNVVSPKYYYKIVRGEGKINGKIIPVGEWIEATSKIVSIICESEEGLKILAKTVDGSRNNSREVTGVISSIDRTPPIITLFKISNKTLSVVANDGTGSGIASFKYYMDNTLLGTYSTTNNSHSKAFDNIKNEGHRFKVVATDKAGNVSEPKQLTDTCTKVSQGSDCDSTGSGTTYEYSEWTCSPSGRNYQVNDGTSYSASCTTTTTKRTTTTKATTTTKTSAPTTEREECRANSERRVCEANGMAAVYYDFTCTPTGRTYPATSASFYTIDYSTCGGTSSSSSGPCIPDSHGCGCGIICEIVHSGNNGEELYVQRQDGKVVGTYTCTPGSTC